MTDQNGKMGPVGPVGPVGPPGSPHRSDSKDQWRRWAAGLRSVDGPTAAIVVAHLRSFLAPIDGPVLVYVALPDEVALTGLQVADPVLPRLGDEGTMTLHRDDRPRERHRLGIDQPPAGRPEVDPTALAAVVVPGRVFDRRGYRLGRGGGHYDRLLPRLGSGTPVVGVTVRSRIVARLPRDPHDRPMTHLATELGVRSTS